MDGNQLIEEELGYSLVETLVALAILIAVLVPAVMFLGIAGNNTLARDKIASSGLAKSAMEQALTAAKDSSFVEFIDEKWWVRTHTEAKTRNLYSIEISVFKEDTLNSPLVTLKTSRLWYTEE